jgi:hypothetical protein
MDFSQAGTPIRAIFEELAVDPRDGRIEPGAVTLEETICPFGGDMGYP